MRNKSDSQILVQSQGMDMGEWGSVAASPFGSDFEVRLTPGMTTIIPAFDGVHAVHIHLDYLAEPNEFARATLDIVATAVSTYSTAYIYKMNQTVRHAFREGIFSFQRPISLEDILAWADKNSLNYWDSMKLYLKRLAAIGSKCFVTDEVRLFLKQPGRFVRKHQAKYLPLVTNDPDFGVFTEQEMNDIHSKLRDAHADNRIDLFEFAFTWLLIATGIRPVQMARMRIKDVLIHTGNDGTKRVTLLIPSAKGIKTSTTEYSPRPVAKSLADILIRYVSSIDSSDSDLPLFVPYNRRVGKVLRRISKKLGTYSARTNQPINITAYRFRHTMATRAIALGASDLEVAALLGHKDTLSIKYYRAAMPCHQRPIEKSMGGEMNLIARQFLGRVISGLDEATFKNDSSKLIREFDKLNGNSLGACGSGIECGVTTPRACLDCKLFQPLADAPWKWLEAELIREIECQTNPELKKISERHLALVRAIQKACTEINSKEPEDVT